MSKNPDLDHGKIAAAWTHFGRQIAATSVRYAAGLLQDVATGLARAGDRLTPCVKEASPPERQEAGTREAADPPA